MPRGHHANKDHTIPRLKTNRTQDYVPAHEHSEKPSNTYTVAAYSSLDNCDAAPLVEEYLRCSSSGTKLRRAFVLEDMMAHLGLKGEEEGTSDHLDWVHIEVPDGASQKDKKEEASQENQVKKEDVWVRSWNLPLMGRGTNDKQKNKCKSEPIDTKAHARPPCASSLLKRPLRSA